MAPPQNTLPSSHDRCQLPSVELPNAVAWHIAEVAVMVILCFLYAGGSTPDVNEAHYLCKAKHFWNPSWCPHDFFLDSADAHWVFYWTVGWLTRFFSLPVVAWIGRVVTWTVVSTSWWKLGQALRFERGWSLLSFGLALLLWDRCHMAGEWVIGGVEAKGLAYGFIFWALAEMVRGRWWSTFLILGAASSLHVLVGGWTTLAAVVVCIWDRKRTFFRADVLSGLVLGGLLALPGLIPALRLSLSATSAEQWLASEIYVYERLGHHLLPQLMHPQLILRFTLLSSVWVGLVVWCRPDTGLGRLQQLVGMALLLALVGVAIAWCLSNSRALTSVWMRYYWFRQSDSLVPAGVALLWISQLRRMLASMKRSRLAAVLVSMTVAASICHLGNIVAWRCFDPRPNAVLQGSRYSRGEVAMGWSEYVDWRELCDWIRTETAADTTILSPYRQQTLKWFAERAELVTWKDVPQDTAGLVDWWQRSRAVRLTRLYRQGRRLSTARLRQAVCDYDVDYIVVEQWRGALPPDLPVVFQNTTFRLHRVPTQYCHPEIPTEGSGFESAEGSSHVTP